VEIPPPLVFAIAKFRLGNRATFFKTDDIGVCLR